MESVKIRFALTLGESSLGFERLYQELIGIPDERGRRRWVLKILHDYSQRSRSDRAVVANSGTSPNLSGTVEPPRRYAAPIEAVSQEAAAIDQDVVLADRRGALMKAAAQGNGFLVG